jgi:triacylglycerol lipase
MPKPNGRNHASKRVHIVLVPGFAGFDALGQMEYYAGVTPLFHSRTGNEVLHYFDNLPTAAVVTRATRLREYLAKRMARGEILPHDDVILVGHSTGGLDIRYLLWDLHHRAHPDVVDGGVSVEAGKIRESIRRVVFLSVPHWGTNIADWVRDHGIERKAVVAGLQAAVAGSQQLLLDSMESSIAGGAATLMGAELFLAVQDALSEANEYIGKQTPVRKAEAHEAASELALYLRDMASDFHAIDDLTSRPGDEGTETSPAHFSDAMRKDELKLMRGIEFLSYVTMGRRPFHFEANGPAPAWKLSNPLTYPEIINTCALSRGTDIVYRTCYRACAGGPFEKWESHSRKSRRLYRAQPHPIELWDNDGIVNTLSMLWPRGENFLVAADHMDIVGQYKHAAAAHGGGRTYRAYDLLKSRSGFDQDVFNLVWEEIFAFCRGHVRRSSKRVAEIEARRMARKGVQDHAVEAA